MMREDDDVTQDRDAAAVEQQLLDELRRVASAVDPVPAEALFAARSAFAYHRLDAALAELTFDSLERQGEPAGVRSADTAARQLSFQAGPLLVEVEVLVDGDQRQLVGQCVPGGPVDIDIRQPGSDQTVASDDLGRFQAQAEPGPVSLRCTWPMTQQVIETAWVVI